MAVVYVHATRGREFLNHYADWCRSQPREGFGRIDMMPPEGPPIGEEKQFVRVPESFLTHLTQRRFPYRLGG
jgi:hypothetical protein